MKPEKTTSQSDEISQLKTIVDDEWANYERLTKEAQASGHRWVEASDTIQ